MGTYMVQRDAHPCRTNSPVPAKDCSACAPQFPLCACTAHSSGNGQSFDVISFVIQESYAASLWAVEVCNLEPWKGFAQFPGMEMHSLWLNSRQTHDQTWFSHGSPSPHCKCITSQLYPKKRERKKEESFQFHFSLSIINEPHSRRRTAFHTKVPAKQAKQAKQLSPAHSNPIKFKTPSITLRPSLPLERRKKSKPPNHLSPHPPSMHTHMQSSPPPKPPPPPPPVPH